MGEIDHAHDAENQVQPARHQRVNAAEQNSTHQQFRYRHAARSALPATELKAKSHPPAATASICCPDNYKPLLQVKPNCLDTLQYEALFVWTTVGGTNRGENDGHER